MPKPLNLQNLIAKLDPQIEFELANAVPDGEMLWASFLPERQQDSYRIEDSEMHVYSTMAGMVGRDSPYPPGGVVRAQDFKEDILKWAVETALGENDMIKLMQLAQRVGVGGRPNVQVVEALLNLEDKVVGQGLRDAMEWMRGQVMQTGILNFTFGQKTVNIDFGIPAGNKLSRLNSGAGSWYTSGTTLWADLEIIRQALDRRILGMIMTETTAQTIFNTAENNIQVQQTARTRYSARYTLRRVSESLAANTIPTDFRSSFDIITYDRLATVYDPDGGNATGMQHIPMMADDLVVVIGQPRGGFFDIGSTPLPEHTLGATVVGPTVEGGGAPGRWTRLFTPQTDPGRIIAQGATNALAFLREPRKIITVALGV
jgi:hypothetical protein